MKTSLKDALHNASARVVRSEVDIIYSRGVIVGAVSALVDEGLPFQRALDRIIQNMPYDSVDGCFPESWVAPRGVSND